MPNFSSGQNIVRIDGEKIRRIREEKGLTQLYLATVVEVTTDTVSRWENKRYPTIKEENAFRLAEALEVEIEEILETEEQVDPGEVENLHSPVEEIPETITPVKPKPLVGFLILSLIALIGGLWWFFSRPAPVSATVERLMPSHTTAGKLFPIVVQVHTDRPESFSLLLKETIPAGFKVEKSSPSLTSRNGSGTLKWVSRTSGSLTSFTYLVRAPEDGLRSFQHKFEGFVTLGKDIKSPQQVSGNAAIEITTFHWADTNRDNIIDDEEILTAYDNFSSLDELDFNWDIIDEMWSGQGYRWDSNSRQYIIIP